MARFLFLFLILFCGNAFAQGEVSASGYSIEDAHKLIEGRCNAYLKAAKGKISNIFKDEECELAASIIENEAAVKSVELLISSLRNLLDKLPPVSTYTEDENMRYVLYGKSLRVPDSHAEDIVETCLANPKKVAQNRPSCRVSTEVMVERLNKDLEAAKKKLLDSQKNQEGYRKYFEEHPAEIDKILNGRCKEVLKNTWYKFDVTLHDSECDAANIEQDILLRKAVNIAGKKILKGKDYFNRNILEARETAKKCDAGEQGDITKAECASASAVVKEQNEVEKNSLEFKKYWSENLSEAKKFAKTCEAKQGLAGNELLRCQIALLIVKEEVKKRKEAKRIEKFKENFRTNLNEAKKTLQGGCVDKELECKAAEEVIEEVRLNRAKDAFMGELQKYLSQHRITGSENLQQYDLLVKNYTDKKTDIEGFAHECIENAKDADKIRVECNAAVNVLMANYQTERVAREEAKNAKPKNKEYYVRYFSDHPEKLDVLLNGRCKDVFADPWYNSDEELRDLECDMALVTKRTNDGIALAKEVEKNRKVVKDRTYFIKNFSEAEALANDCHAGKVASLDECEASMYVVTEKTSEESKRATYEEYYSGHPLAAKFFVRWCKTSMLSFSTKCQAAENALKKYDAKKHKVYKDEVFERDVEKLKEAPEKARELLQGRCKTLFEDPWYYLDESIRSEQCDAAAEIARLVMEAQYRKKAAAEKAAGMNVENKINAEKPAEDNSDPEKHLTGKEKAAPVVIHDTEPEIKPQGGDEKN